MVKELSPEHRPIYLPYGVFIDTTTTPDLRHRDSLSQCEAFEYRNETLQVPLRIVYPTRDSVLFTLYSEAPFNQFTIGLLYLYTCTGRVVNGRLRSRIRHTVVVSRFTEEVAVTYIHTIRLRTPTDPDTLEPDF